MVDIAAMGSGSKITKLRIEVSLQSEAADWLNWITVFKLTNHKLGI
jgi:hypothetical protein